LKKNATYQFGALNVNSSKTAEGTNFKFLAVETNIFHVFHKPVLWHDISEAILLFFSEKNRHF